MSPFETLYGRGFRTLLNWKGLVNKVLLEPEILKEMEQEVAKIKQNLKVSQYKKKSYADLKRVHKAFKIRFRVYLGVKPRKRSLKLGIRAMLAPTYCHWVFTQ